jgi:hypothetical protein
MTELEITERLIRAAEVEDRLPRVGPARLKAMAMPYVHTEEDMRGWGKRVGEHDRLRKEDADAHALHRREFWDRVSVTARDVSEAEEAWGWLALVENVDHRAALAAWAGCMADNTRRFFKDWCKGAKISEKTGRKRKDRAVTSIFAHLVRSDVQNADIGSDQGLLDHPETEHVDGRIGDAWRENAYPLSQSSKVPEFDWHERRNERRRQQEAKRRREAA